MRKWKLILAVIALGLAACICFAQGKSEKKGKKDAAKADAAKGRDVFMDNCAQCHEAYSKEEKVGPGLQGIKDGKLPDGKPATHDKLLDIVNNGPAEMPSFQERLTEREKEDVIAFVMSL